MDILLQREGYLCVAYHLGQCAHVNPGPDAVCSEGVAQRVDANTLHPGSVQAFTQHAPQVIALNGRAKPIGEHKRITLAGDPAKPNGSRMEALKFLCFFLCGQQPDHSVRERNGAPAGLRLRRRY